MSRERRNISQRKIRRISQKPDEIDLEKDESKYNLKFDKLSPNTKLYYSKVIFGASSGAFTGTFFLLFPSISTDVWFVFLITGLSLCVAFVRQILKILPDQIDSKRIWLSGTFTFVLLFIVVSSLIWMLPGPRPDLLLLN